MSTEQKRGIGVGGLQESRGPAWGALSGPAGGSSTFLGQTGGNKAEVVSTCQAVGGLGYPTKSLDSILKEVRGQLQDLSPRMT